MKITFLGTSSGVPTKQRNVTAIAIQQTKRRWCLVDCGEGTQHQLLHTSFSLRDLETIFITHVHGDHCYGLPGLLASAVMHGRTKPLQIIAPDSVREWMQPVISLSEMRLSYEIIFQDVATMSVLALQDFQVQPIPLSHRVPSYGYYFFVPPMKKARKLDQAKLLADGVPVGPIWGKLQRGEHVILPDDTVLLSEDYCMPEEMQVAQRVIIAGDNDTPALLAPFCDDIDVIVHEATFTQSIADKVGSAPQHTSAASIAQFAASIATPSLILTHFSARYDKESIGEIEQEARQFYHGNLFLADDFSTFALSKGRLVRT